MRFTIAVKIFGIALGLLLLMVVAALIGLRMTRTVDDQLGELINDYFPAYATLAQANTRNEQESAYIRRLMLAFAENPRSEPKIAELHRRVTDAAADSDAGIAETRRLINRQIANALSVDDSVALGRLDTLIGFLQEERRKYEQVFAKLIDAAQNRDANATSLLNELDNVRDDFDRRITEDQAEMRRLAETSVSATQAYQRRVVEISLLLLVAAGVLCLARAAAGAIG